jgi:hypothetical protein
VIGVGDGDERFGLIRRGVKLLGLGDRHERILFAVQDEQRAAIGGELVDRGELVFENLARRREREFAIRDVGQFRETAFEDQAAGAVGGGELDRDGAAEGLAVEDDCALRDTGLRGEELAGGAGVGVQAGFAGVAFTPAVAAVVEREDGDA